MKTRLVWLVLFVAVSVPQAYAQVVGRVLVAVGDVVVQRAGKDVALATGSTVENRDVVRVGEASNAQIRFTDESVVALRAKTVFRIDDYAFSGKEDGLSKAFYSLVSGGMRALTGLIGKTDREKYRVNAPLATVGIRGTSYTLVVCQQDCIDNDGSIAPDGNYGVVLEGRVAITNEGGTQEFGVDEAFFVESVKTPAKPLLSRPGFLRDRLEARARIQQRREQLAQARIEQQQASGDVSQQDGRKAPPPGQPDFRPLAGGPGSGTAPIVATELRDGSGQIAVLGAGLGLGVSWAGATTQRADVEGGRGTVIALDELGGAVERFTFGEALYSGARGQAAVLDSDKSDGDGGMRWGRWAPGAQILADGNTLPPGTGVHFLFGNLTPPAALPQPGSAAAALVGTVNYDYVGGPRPTDGQGNAGQFLNGNFSVNFLDRSIGGAVQYQAGATTYTLPVPIGTPLIAGSGFVGFRVNRTDAGTWACTTCNNASGSIDSFSVSGLFMGSRAQGLGVTFSTLDSQAGRSAGVAAFRCRAGSRC